MTSARDDMLTRIRLQYRDVTPPPVWRSRRHFDDLAARFEEALTKVKGEVIRAASLDEALRRLDETLDALEARCVVVNDELLLAGLDLAARWPGRELHVVGRTSGDLRAVCASADVGLSSADAALAETARSCDQRAGAEPPRDAAAGPFGAGPDLAPDDHPFTFTAARSGATPDDDQRVSKMTSSRRWRSACTAPSASSWSCTTIDVAPAQHRRAGLFCLSCRLPLRA